MTIELLLSHADTHAPVLETGLEVESLRGFPPLVRRAKRSKYLRSRPGDPNDLRLQRWGLIVPKGEEGQRLLKLIEPLRKHREREQHGHIVKVFEAHRGIDQDAALRWLKENLEAEDLEEEERPGYLLILGDLDTISLELQVELSHEAFVGRLAFPTDDGYRAYVDKVLRWAEQPCSARHARPLFYTAKDGSAATRLGHDLLIQPCVTTSFERQAKGLQRMQPPMSWVETGDGPGTAVERFLRFASVTAPSVLFSLSHGMGLPSSGAWASAEEQRAQQGALVLPKDQVLTSKAVASGAFLPGGVWFGLACFSAGTPVNSIYATLLQDLSTLHPSVARFAGTPLHEPGGRPFIAALPQAALANPEGPLAVVGHVDLAWTTSFNEQGISKHKRFREVIETIGHRHRVGLALAPLHDIARQLGRRQATSSLDAYKARKSKRRARDSDSDHAFDWLQIFDLSSYVLLGDPAVHLPLVAPPS